MPPVFADQKGIKLTKKHIYDEIVYRVYRKTKLEPEVLICGFILFQKIIGQYKVTRHTIKICLVTCLMIESKVNDDRSMLLKSFSRQMDIATEVLL